ncbi:hypothetical protein GJAV_G00183730 [Gymnothorax javanicus]|nr:hypothetical protein GJAV_G00183730 [Gymnothorax javanicus]
MFSVVCFDETAEVEVVPTRWFDNSTCWWPPYKAEGVNRAIKNLEQPTNTWPAFNARTLFSSNNYLECRQKLTQAQEMTDLASEEKSSSTQRPKRKSQVDMSCQTTPTAKK